MTDECHIEIERMPLQEKSRDYVVNVGSYIQTAGPDIFSRLTRKPVQASDWVGNKVITRTLDRLFRLGRETNAEPVVGIMRFDDDRWEGFRYILEDHVNSAYSGAGTCFDFKDKWGLIEVSYGTQRAYFAPAQKITTAEGPIVAFGNPKRIGDSKRRKIEDIAKEIHDQGAMVVAESDLLRESRIKQKLASIYYRTVNKTPDFSVKSRTLEENLDSIDAIGLNPVFHMDAQRLWDFAEEEGESIVVVGSERQPEHLGNNYVSVRNLDVSGLTQLVGSFKEAIGELEEGEITLRKISEYSNKGLTPYLNEILPLQLGLGFKILYRNEGPF